MVSHLVEDKALVVRARWQRVERRDEVAVDPMLFDADEEGHRLLSFRGSGRSRGTARRITGNSERVETRQAVGKAPITSLLPDES
jgi:hypothetical protein